MQLISRPANDTQTIPPLLSTQYPFILSDLLSRLLVVYLVVNQTFSPGMSVSLAIIPSLGGAAVYIHS